MIRTPTMAYPNRSPHALPENTPPGHPGSYRHSPMSSHVRGPRSASSNSSQSLNTPVRPNLLPSGTYQDEMIGQAEEQQSIYRDHGISGVNDYEVEDYQTPNPRKRINTEGLDNPKKRAAVAVSFFGATAVFNLLSIHHG